MKKLGGADAILATAPSGGAIASLLPGLKVRGKIIVVGVAPDPMPISTVPLVFGARSVLGSLTGSAIEMQDTLDFSVLSNVRPLIEVVPLEQAPVAYARDEREGTFPHGLEHELDLRSPTNRFYTETFWSIFAATGKRLRKLPIDTTALKQPA